jgi:hypothetical protein
MVLGSCGGGYGEGVHWRGCRGVVPQGAVSWTGPHGRDSLLGTQGGGALAGVPRRESLGGGPLEQVHCRRSCIRVPMDWSLERV